MQPCLGGGGGGTVSFGHLQAPSACSADFLTVAKKEIQRLSRLFPAGPSPAAASALIKRVAVGMAFSLRCVSHPWKWSGEFSPTQLNRLRKELPRILLMKTETKQLKVSMAKKSGGDERSHFWEPIKAGLPHSENWNCLERFIKNFP